MFGDGDGRRSGGGQSSQQQAPPAVSQQEGIHKWIFLMQSRELHHQIRFDGSALADLVRVKVSYCKPTAPSAVTVYQAFWLKDNQLYGLERVSKLNLQDGDDVAFKIATADGGTQGEYEAIAAALLRMQLEMYVNGYVVNSVICPSGATVQALSRELQRKGFEPASSTNGMAPVQMRLQADDGTAVKLNYSR